MALRMSRSVWRSWTSFRRWTAFCASGIVPMTRTPRTVRVITSSKRVKRAGALCGLRAFPVFAKRERNIYLVQADPETAAVGRLNVEHFPFELDDGRAVGKSLYLDKGENAGAAFDRAVGMGKRHEHPAALVKERG